MMHISLILNLIGTVAMLAYGLTSFFAPQTVAKAVYATLQGKRGQAEFRIGNGGFFTGMALWALLHQNPQTFQVLGIAWLGSALFRLIASLIDGIKLAPDYVGLFFLELLMGIFLFLT